MPEQPQDAPESNNEKDVTFLSLFDPREPRTPSELKEDRLAICRSCEFFNHRLEQCTKCGCFMRLKTTLNRAHCPIQKW